MMTDVSVQDIIATFKNIERQVLYSSVQTDSFIELMKAKKNWTLDEYKEFSLAYALENMRIQFMDKTAIRDVSKKYSFQLDWNDYFNVIEHITNNKKKKAYVNYYFWYHYTQMTEQVYQQFKHKPYFNLLTSKTKIHFLSHKITTDNKNSWILHYFTADEIKKALKKNTLNINLRSNNTALEKEIKEFYNNFERFMDYPTKVKFFHEAVKTGVISLVTFLYQEKGINKLNLVKLLWHVCADTASSNTLEILQCLTDLGIKLTPSLLRKLQNNHQWPYMEHRDALVTFIMDREREKNYLKLNKKLKTKAQATDIKKI